MAVVEECGKVPFSLCRPAGEWLLLNPETNVALLSVSFSPSWLLRRPGQKITFLCSLKRQQQSRWTRQCCLDIHLIKSALPDGPSAVQRTKLEWLETALQSQCCGGASWCTLGPSLTDEIFGSLKFY